MQRRTPLCERHPGRRPILLNDPDLNQGLVYTVSKALHEASEIEIAVEVDDNDRRQSLSLRRSLEKQQYEEAHAALSRAIKSCTASLRIRISKNDPQCQARISGSALPSERRFPRIGAFEVILRWRQNEGAGSWQEALLFSKLYSECWPKMAMLARHMKDVLTAAGSIKGASTSQSAFVQDYLIPCAVVPPRKTAKIWTYSQPEANLKSMLLEENQQQSGKKQCQFAANVELEEIYALRLEICRKNRDLHKFEADFSELARRLHIAENDRNAEMWKLRVDNLTRQLEEVQSKSALELCQLRRELGSAQETFRQKSQEVHELIERDKENLKCVECHDLRIQSLLVEKAEFVDRHQKALDSWDKAMAEKSELFERHEKDLESQRVLELRNTSLVAELENARVQAQRCQADVESARVLTLQLEHRNTSLVAELENARVRCQADVDSVLGLKLQMHELELRNTSLVAELENARIQAQRCQADVESFHVLKLQLEHRNTSLVAELENARVQAQDFQAESERMHELERQNTSLVAELQDSRVQARAYQTVLHQMVELKTELTDMDELAKVLHQIDELTSCNTRLSTELKAARQEKSRNGASLSERVERFRQEELKSKSTLATVLRQVCNTLIETSESVKLLRSVHMSLMQEQVVPRSAKAEIVALVHDLTEVRRGLSCAQRDVHGTCMELVEDLQTKDELIQGKDVMLQSKIEMTLELERRLETVNAQATLSQHQLESCAWCPKGQRFAAVTSDYAIVVRGAAETFTATMRGHTDIVRGVSWSPLGDQLASYSLDATVVIWNESMCKRKLTLSGHSGAVIGAAWTAAGDRLASYSQDRLVILWDTGSGERLVTLQQHTDSVTHAAWNAAGDRVASCSLDLTVIVWVAATGKVVCTLEGHTCPPLLVAWSSCQQFLASCCVGRQMVVWDTEAGKSSLTFEHVGGVVLGLTWNKLGDRLAAYTSEASVVILAPQASKQESTLHCQQCGVSCVLWNPDGWRFASLSIDRTVVLWDGKRGLQLFKMKGPGGTLFCIRWKGEKLDELQFNSDDMGVTTWSAKTGKPVADTVDERPCWVRSVGWSPSGTMLASCTSGSNKVSVWDATSGELMQDLSEGHSDWVRDVAWDPSGERLASCSQDRTAIVWYLSLGRAATLRGHSGAVLSVSWSPSGDRLATCSDDKTVRVWDTALPPPESMENLPTTCREVLQLIGHRDKVNCLCWSPYGKHVASCAADGVVLVWNTATGVGRSLVGIQRHRSALGVSWGLNGKNQDGRLAVAYADSTVVVWDPVRAEQISVIRASAVTGVGAGRMHFAVSWDPSGKRLAVSADDQSVALWDVDRCERTLVLEGHKGIVFGVKWHPSGRLLASCGSDSRAIVWDTDTGRSLLTKVHLRDADR